jgi:hypothetical protein
MNFPVLKESKEEESFIDIEEQGSSEGKEEDVSLSEVYASGNHFIDKLTIELDNIKQKHTERHVDQFFSNSPLTMSVCSTRINSESDTMDENNTMESKKKKFVKLTYKEVEDSLNRHYTKELQISSELDILLTYLKGQRHIFNQASRVTLQKFNFLMFPALFITGSMTVLSPFLDTIGWSNLLVSVLNAILTIMITINNFMKWQAIAAIYLTISNQFDKLAVSVEMSRNQFLFVDDNKEKATLILEKMRDTETRIMNIQNNYNDIVIPYEVQLLNPIISHINIFSFIKKIEHHKKNLIMKYKHVKNEIRYAMTNWDNKEPEGESKVPENSKMSQIQKLLEKKDQIKINIIQNNNNNVYSYIENLFIREIQHSQKYYTYHSAGMFLILRPKPLERTEYGNPVVDEYLNFIFTE